jgi:hypothetical protein
MLSAENFHAPSVTPGAAARVESEEGN